MNEPARLLPDPGRLWIRFRPRRWPAPGDPWTDLAAATLGRGQAAAEVAVSGELDDLLYLPPVEDVREGERRRLAREHAERGTPILWQTLPGAEPPPAEATPVYDLLPMLLAGSLEPIDRLPAGATAVWPLIAGLTDAPGLQEEGCRRAAAAGARCLQPMLLTLSSSQRRLLAEGRDEATYRALFHRRPPAERSFSVVAARHGLEAFFERPLPRAPLAGASNRAAAGVLLLAAELCLRLDRPVGRGLAFSRAARWVDAAPYDVAGLAREGNLSVVEEIDQASRELLERWAARRGDGELDDLLGEYVRADAQAPEPRDEPDATG